MRKHARVARVCGILVAYALLALLMTWPVVARLGSRLVGGGDDMWVQYWNNWWVRKAAVEGGNVYSTDLLFYPQTASLVFHNFGWVNVLGCLLVEPVVGPIAAYNLVYLANVTLCAFAAYLLVRHLLGSTGPAFVAGLIYGFWPYRLSDYDHPNMISTQWMPLVLLGTILLIRQRGKVRHALCVGLLLALTALSRWQMLLPTAIALGVWLAFSALFERERWSWHTVRGLSLALLVAALLLAFPSYPLARDLVTGAAGGRLSTGQEAEKQTDLVAYVVPPVHHPLASLFDGLDYVHSPVRFRYSAFVGYSVLALLVAGTAWRWREARPWAVLALAAFLLALGPVLRVDQRLLSGVPMPYRLVGWLAPLRWWRYPHRFNALLALPIAVLAGFGATVLRSWLLRRRTNLLWGTLSVLVLFEYYNLPSATVRAEAPAFYESLSQEREDFAVLDLPLGRDKGDYYMFYQTVHGRPIAEGNTARPQPDLFVFLDESPLLYALREEHEPDAYPGDISRQLAALASAGFRYVVAHKPFARPGQLDDWRVAFPFAPAHEDDEVLVYGTTVLYGQEFEFTAEVGDGIGLIDSTLSTGVIPQGGLLEVEWLWGTRSAPGRDWTARLALVSPAGEMAQEVSVDLCAGWPTLEWGVNAVARGRAALQVDPFLDGGAYAVTVALVDPDGGDEREALLLGRVDLQVVERVFGEPEVEVLTEVTFGEVLHLLGYDLERGEQGLGVTLHWQALQRMETSFKFFVHLYDAESGTLVVQADVMPCDWTYPTFWWEAGEVVSDRIVISLAGVVPGLYRVAVGVYDPESMEQLVPQAAGARSPALSGNRVVIEDSLQVPGGEGELRP